MTTQHLDRATLAGGCFWCLEAVYEQLNGVKKVESGYTGGHVTDPTYRAVCDGTTGHAEAVQVTFDPTQVAYKDLVEIFFTIHDPTTLDRQGHDIGTQYRSAIYYHNPAQKTVAEQVIADLTQKKVWRNPIVTEVTPLGMYYPAEEYHRRYYQRNPYAGYCQAIIEPKVAKFRKQYLARLQA